MRLSLFEGEIGFDAPASTGLLEKADYCVGHFSHLSIQVVELVGKN